MWAQKRAFNFFNFNDSDKNTGTAITYLSPRSNVCGYVFPIYHNNPTL